MCSKINNNKPTQTQNRSFIMTTKTTKTTKTPTAKTVDKLILAFAEKDQIHRAKTADATQSRADRSAAAVELILTAQETGACNSDDATTAFRAALLESGVLKGTVSKVISVIVAINEGRLDRSEVASLNGAWTLAKRRYEERSAALAALGAAAAAASLPVTITTGSGEPVDDDVVLAYLRNKVATSKNPRAEAGKILTWVTEAVIAVADAHDADIEK